MGLRFSRAAALRSVSDAGDLFLPFHRVMIGSIHLLISCPRKQ